MFRFRLLALLIFTSAIVAGQQIPIQFALTDTAGIELENRTVDVKATLTSDTTSFTLEYQETQSVTTNDFGIASFWIGEGNTTLSSSNSSINTNWLNPNTDYFIVLQVDSTGLGFDDLATIRYQLPLVAVKAQNADTSVYARSADTSLFSSQSNQAYQALTADTSDFALRADTSLYSAGSDSSLHSLASDTSQLALNAEFSDTAGYSITIDPGAFSDSSSTNEIQSLEQVLAIDSNANNKSIYNLKSLSIGDTLISSSAALSITSTNAGLLLPRLTKIQRDVISNPEQGLMVYCTDCEAEGRVSIYDGNTWELLMQTTSAGQPPTITTGAVENIGISTATFNASILDSGDTEIFVSGFCWGLSPYPTISDFTGIANLLDSNAILKGNVFGLDSNNTYYVRAYASNGAGTTYGPSVQFKTDGMRSIGEEYGGGYVAYLFQPGDLGYVQGEQHGIIMYPFDYPTKIPFGPTFCDGGTTIYDWPNLNTTTYVLDSTRVNTNVGYAIHNHNLLMTSGICATQPHLPAIVDTLDWNGYSDWILPTQSDLLMIFNNVYLLNLPGNSSLTENERYITSCTNGIYSSSSTSTLRISTVSFDLSSTGYPYYTQSVTTSTEYKWYASAYTFRPIRYF